VIFPAALLRGDRADTNATDPVAIIPYEMFETLAAAYVVAVTRRPAPA
jgi:hypothetical protein